MYKQSQYLSCLAKTRPSYCKFDTPKCCFSCVYNKECMEYAIKNKMIRPCSKEIFEEEEICEFSA